MFSKPTKTRKIEQTGKNPQNYITEKNETCLFEQKPMEIDVFNDEEEKEIKERVEKLRKKKARSSWKKQIIKAGKKKPSKKRKTRKRRGDI